MTNTHWMLHVGKEKSLIDHDLAHIREALLRLDGKTLYEVALDRAAMGSLVAAGGDHGRYLVIYFPLHQGQQSSYTLTDLSLTGPDVTVTAQTPAESPAKWCVQAALVLQVFEHFFRTGQLPRDVRWELDASGKQVTW